MHKFGLPLLQALLTELLLLHFAFWSWNLFSFDSSPANTHNLPLLSHSGFVFLNHDYMSVKCRVLKYLTTAFHYYCFIILLFFCGRSVSQACAGGSIPAALWNEHGDFLPHFQSLVFMPFFASLNIFNSTFKMRIYYPKCLERSTVGWTFLGLGFVFL